jgi:hypothetical protein
MSMSTEHAPASEVETTGFPPGLMTDELRRTHARLSRWDLDFRLHAAASPDLQERTNFPALEEHRDLLLYPLQPWPTFVRRPLLDELARRSITVTRLIKEIPRRIFRGDTQAMARFYGLASREQMEIILCEPNGVAEAISRGDFIHTEAGFQCIEFNFTPRLGGWETSILADLHLKVPVLADYLNRRGIDYSYVNTLRVLFTHVVNVARSQGWCGDRVEIAFALSPGDMKERDREPARRVFDAELQAALRALGAPVEGHVTFCTYAEITPRADGIWHAGRKIHVLIEGSDPEMDLGIYRAYKAGKFGFFNGPMSDLLSSKASLALLSENVGSGCFDEPEQAFIESCIPWSRRMRRGKTTFRGSEVALEDLLVNAREELVLKEARSFGGKGVTLGSSAPAAEWAELARTAFEQEGSWIVQQRLRSLPYLFQCGENGCAPHDVIWGPFVFGATYGGVILRVQPNLHDLPVNLSLAATEGFVLSVAD